MKKKYIGFLLNIFLIILYAAFIYSQFFSIKMTQCALAQSSDKLDILANENDNKELEHKILLEKKEKYLDKREEDINKQQSQLNEHETKLTELEREINLILDEKIKKLESLKADIKEGLQEKDRLENQKIIDLAKLYEGATPERAGSIIEKLDPKTAARLFLLMNKKDAGKIWGFVNPDIAVKITKYITDQEKIKNKKDE